LVLLGVALALVLELCGISALPFAVGVYLPISASTPIFVGGIIRYLVDRKIGSQTEAEAETGPGILFSSGLIAGGSIAGILLALTQVTPGLSEKLNFSQLVGNFATSDLISSLIFLVTGGILFRIGSKKKV
jgi:uncharacterized oligopeptide transporter (OPT) family protein